MELHTSIMCIRKGVGVMVGILEQDLALSWDEHPFSATMIRHWTRANGDSSASFSTGLVIPESQRSI